MNMIILGNYYTDKFSLMLSKHLIDYYVDIV